MSELGRLEQVPLRSVWSDEAQSFTPWLAQPDNLRLLGTTLGLDLDPEDEEVAVGPFSADILCKDMTDGSWVLIENQIERTDHRHLGQILTYAAGLSAKTLVWVAAKFTDEHRAALDWLNEHTTEEISFFGLEIELWRIGASAPAPKFNIVSKPNDWSKAIRSNTAGTDPAKVTEHKKLQFEFWTAFKSYLEERSNLRSHKPAYQHWLNVTIGRTGFHLSAITSAWNTITESWGSEIRVELIMNSALAKEHFAKLLLQQRAFQAAVDLPLTWHNPEESKSAKVYVRQDADFADKSKWPEQFDWLVRYLMKFEQVFGPAIKTL